MDPSFVFFIYVINLLDAAYSIFVFVRQIDEGFASVLTLPSSIFPNFPKAPISIASEFLTGVCNFLDPIFHMFRYIIHFISIAFFIPLHSLFFQICLLLTTASWLHSKKYVVEADYGNVAKLDSFKRSFMVIPLLDFKSPPTKLVTSKFHGPLSSSLPMYCLCNPFLTAMKNILIRV